MSSLPIPSEGEPVFLTAANWGIAVPAGTGSGSLTMTATNFPGQLTGSNNPYVWFKVVAPDGTSVYIAAFK